MFDGDDNGHYFNFLKTVAHLGYLVCKRPSIYKIKA